MTRRLALAVLFATLAACRAGVAPSTQQAAASGTSRLDVHPTPASTPPAAAGPVAAKPRVIVLADGASEPSALAVDASSVYWIDRRGLKRVAKGGGAVTILDRTTSLNHTLAGADCPVNRQSIAVDAADVFWTRNLDDATEPANGWLTRIDKNGGQPTVVVSSVGKGGHAYPPVHGVALDEASVYWVEGSSDWPYRERMSIMRAPKSGGAPVRVASHQEGADSVAVDDARLYWNADLADGSIRRAPKGGGAATSIVQGLGSAGSSSWGASLYLHVDDKNVYWVSGDAEVMAAPKGGGPAVRLVQVEHDALRNDGSIPIGGIAVDGDSVYFTEPGERERATGRVSRVAKDGSGRTILATEQPRPLGIVVDHGAVYWVCYGVVRKGDGELAGNVSKLEHP